MWVAAALFLFGFGFIYLAVEIKSSPVFASVVGEYIKEEDGVPLVSLLVAGQ